MKISHHITDPSWILRDKDFEEPLEVRGEGSAYGRFLFTDWEPFTIYNCTVRVRDGDVAIRLVRAIHGTLANCLLIGGGWRET